MKTKTHIIRRPAGLERRHGFWGPDFCRSPDAVNMLLDAHGLPAKRTGFKRLRDFAGYGGTIYGLHSTEAGGEERLLVHAGDRLWLCGESEAELLHTGLAPAFSSGFVSGGAAYLMDGRSLWRVSGHTAAPALAAPYAPLTRKNAHPSGSGGAHEAPNLLTDARRNSFRTDGETAVFKLDAYPVAGSVTARPASGELLEEGRGLSVYRHAAAVTFATPPAAGAEGVEIRFRAAGRPLGAAAAINRCTLWGRLGETVFLSGNPDLPGREWGSPDLAAAYFPDTLVGDVGDPGLAVCGYAQHHEGLVILKRPGDDAGVYLRENGGPPRPGGDGPAAVGGIGRLGSRCLYLAREGLMELTAASRRSARRSVPCGEAVSELLKGAAEAGGRAYSLAGRYYLSVPGGLLMGQTGPTGEAEWSFWPLFAVSAFGRLGGRLCVSSGSRLYRLCEPDEPGAYLDDGAAYTARRSTPPLDFGDPGRLKKLTGAAVTLRGQAGAAAEVSVSGGGLCVPLGRVEAGESGEARVAKFFPRLPPALSFALTLENSEAAPMPVGELQLTVR